MVETKNLYHYEMEIEKDATRAWYARAEAWGCECGDCRNFLAVAESGLLPRPVLDRLRSLDIQPVKATYVCHLTEEKGSHLYQFSYRIAGNILRTPVQDGAGPVKEVGRCCHETYPYGAPDFPQPHFDLEFVVELPWVLEESCDESSGSSALRKKIAGLLRFVKRVNQ